MAYTHQTLEELAPDQASLAAARGLLNPKRWPTLAVDGPLLWGLCQGSGSTPYRAVFDGEERGYKCTCPSRKFPCKHVLALAWLALDQRAAFQAEPRPDWVQEWLTRRKRPGDSDPAGAPRVDADAAPRARPSLAAAAATADEHAADPADPRAAERAARARERNRERREADTAAGLDELDTWIGDVFARGLAASVSGLAAAARPIARRLADAKASALATRLEELPAEVAAAPDGARQDTLLHALGELHLVAEAYRRQAALPAGVRADVRQAVGWTTTREALEADPEALRVAGVFDVVAVRDELQADKLRRLETWLLLRPSAADRAATPRFALLLEYVPASTRGAASGLGVGEAVEATVVHYPSAAPLRAVFSSAGARPCAGGALAPAGATLGAALAALDETRVCLPWLGARPLHADGCSVRMAVDGTFWLTDAGGSDALPISPEQREQVFALAGLPPFTMFAIVERGVAFLCLARTSLGTWSAR